MESKIQSSIRKHMLGKGWIVLRLLSVFPRGNPDLLCLKSGISLFIEAKDTGKKPDKNGLQLLRIEQLTAAGFHAFWTDSLDYVKEYLLKYDLDKL